MTRTALLTFAIFVLTTADAVGQPNFETPKSVAPDPVTRKQIEAKTADLRAALSAFPPRTDPSVRADVEVYLKAAEWIVRHGEFFVKESPKQTLAVLDVGLARAKAAADGKTPWRDVRGKPVVRGYRSSVDGSVQPYSVTIPDGFGQGDKKWRLDIVLHGRDQTLTEVKFLAQREAAKPAAKATDYVVLEPYGRGNNAYRWAGERDVFEALTNFFVTSGDSNRPAWHPIDHGRIVLRGFSMGGAGTWHIGLHHPFRFAVIGPGAGFTTTHGYIRNLPAKLPEYVERCLHIYDAVDYAENAFNVPVVAYSGEKDPQKAAADNIEQLLKVFKEPVRFTHLVAPGLEHRQPPEWQAKADAEYRKHLAGGPRWPERVRFVTYTTRYYEAAWVQVEAIDRHYEKAVVDGIRTKDKLELTTANVRGLLLIRGELPFPPAARIDGQVVPLGGDAQLRRLIKQAGKWEAVPFKDRLTQLHDHPEKTPRLQGPIDDAFRESFVVVPPDGDGWYRAVGKYLTAAADRFGREWDKYFRGKLPTRPADQVDLSLLENLVLFGDPASNPLIAKVAEKLPIKWTKDTLEVNGKRYDPRTHVPVLIYPNPFSPSKYVVINSGHTFHAADLRGTNALLYPRLGDWAVLKPTPTANDPTAAEVVDAGLFDEFWQFATVTQDGGTKPIAAPGAKLEKLWGEGEFTEGPAAGPDGCVYFSDIGNRIMKFDPATGKTTTFRDPSGRANGLKFDANGRLVACEGANTGGNRRVSVTLADGTVKSLADSWQGKRFNSPNDLTIDAKGRVYFTDPRYVGSEPREIDTESVYRIDKDGSVTRIITDVTKPNGIAITPDGKTLYLAESNGDPAKPRQLLAYPLNPDGSVGAKRVLHDFGADRGIDGMTVTADGLIVATAGRGKTAGVYVFTPEGKKVGFLPTPEDPTNCCFAGPDRATLYVTAGKSLYRVKTTLAGK